MREIDVHLHDGLDVVGACRKAGISDKTYYYWRKKFGGLGRPQLSEMKALKKENERLKKIVADLQKACALNQCMKIFATEPCLDRISLTRSWGVKAFRYHFWLRRNFSQSADNIQQQKRG